jgi:hypothetical protein
MRPVVAPRRGLFGHPEEMVASLASKLTYMTATARIATSSEQAFNEAPMINENHLHRNAIMKFFAQTACA